MQLRSRRQLVWSSVCLTGALALGCGVSQPAHPAELASNHMPEGASWDGVYYGSTAGLLHLVSQGDRVIGAWRTDSEDAHGELSGDVRGNLLSYRWTERKVERAGGVVRKGTGYFVYLVNDRGAGDELLGERIWAHHEAALWRAKKWTYVEPDLWNVVPGGASRESEENDGDYYLDSDDDI